MEKISFDAITRQHGLSENGFREQLYVTDKAALQGLHGYEIDYLFDEVQQIARASEDRSAIAASITNLLEDRWEGVDGLLNFANSQLPPGTTVRDLTPKRFAADEKRIPRHAGRLVVARAIANVVRPQGLRFAEPVHAIGEEQSTPGIAGRVRAIREALNSTPSANGGIKEIFRQQAVSRRTVARIGLSELEPRWVFNEWRTGNQAGIGELAALIADSQEIARSRVRAALHERQG